jgi:NAD(P)H-quinone oxidoreductase subunit 2
MLTALFTSFQSSGLGQFITAQNLSFLAPELVIALTLLMTFCLSLARRQGDQARSWGVALFGAILALVTLGIHYGLFYANTEGLNYNRDVMFGMFNADLLALIIRFMLTLAFILILHLSKRFVENRLPGQNAEFYTLLLTAFLGAMLLAGANDMIMAFVALETLGISSYILTGYVRNDLKSTEASLKYLVYGGTSSAFLLFGMALLYGLTGGSTQLAQLPDAFSAIAQPTSWISMALVMILAGIGFKISAAPFHTWAPDVYEGAPTPITAFLSVVSKMAAFAFAIRLLMPFTALANDNLGSMLAILAVLSMAVGNLAALKQTNIKRLLGYSTIAHAGYLLLGLATMTQDSLSTMLFYLITYIFMNTGAFACVMAGQNLLGTEESHAFSGLVRAKPLLTLFFSIFLLALAGIPITAGFFAKFFLFQSVVFGGLGNILLVIIALAASTVSLYYYLNLIKLMVVGEPSTQVRNILSEAGGKLKFNAGVTLSVATALCFLMTLGLGIFSEPLLKLCHEAMRDHGTTNTLTSMK